MRQPAQYVATVRKHAEAISHGAYLPIWPPLTWPPIHKKTDRRVLTEKGAYYVHTVWEIIPRPRHEAFYK